MTSASIVYIIGSWGPAVVCCGIWAALTKLCLMRPCQVGPPAQHVHSIHKSPPLGILTAELLVSKRTPIKDAAKTVLKQSLPVDCTSVLLCLLLFGQQAPLIFVLFQRPSFDFAMHLAFEAAARGSRWTWCSVRWSQRLSLDSTTYVRVSCPNDS